MEWPYRRFIRAFTAMQRRSVCDELRHRRMIHIGGLHANSNLDGEDNPRAKIIEEIETAYDQLIADAWNGTTEAQRIEQSGVLNTGFMRAGQRAVARLTNSTPILPGEEVLSGTR